MAQTLAEYARWLTERDLRWPVPPSRQPVSATPYLKPISGLKAVVWDLYGTLLRIADGELLFQHPQQIRMEVALDKTLQEFHFWNAMSRKPGPPWEQLHSLYTRAYDDLRLAGSGKKGDLTEVDSAKLWRRVLSKLELDKFEYDAAQLGDLDALSEKIAYFFHASLQGLELSPGADVALSAVCDSGFQQGLLADGQCFSLTQLLRGLEAQGTLAAAEAVLSPLIVTLSHHEGIRKPSRSLYLRAVERLRERGVEPEQVLYVGARLREDLVVAKQVGFRTALYAGDKLSLKATPADLRDPAVKPDRLLTELPQVREILGI